MNNIQEATKETYMSHSPATWLFLACSGKHQRKHQSYTLQTLCKGNPPVTSGFPSQRACNTENIFYVMISLCYLAGNPYWLWYKISAALNTLKPRQNGRHFAHNTFKCIFSNENIWISIRILLRFVPKGPINNIPSLVQIMAWHHYCFPMGSWCFRIRDWLQQYHGMFFCKWFTSKPIEVSIYVVMI